MKFFTHYYIFPLILLLMSCQSTIKKSQIEYDKKKKIVYYNNTPYTGIVIGEDEEAFWSAKIVDGVMVSETEKYPNGYKLIRYANGNIEYFDSNNRNVTKKEFDSMFQ